MEIDLHDPVSRAKVADVLTEAAHQLLAFMTKNIELERRVKELEAQVKALERESIW